MNSRTAAAPRDRCWILRSAQNDKPFEDTPQAENILDSLTRTGEFAAMKNTWQLQQAKSEFCAVAEKAARGRPQVVTKHGRPFVVIASMKDWQRTAPKRKTLLEALRACPADLGPLIATRSRELPRDVSL